MGRMLPEGVMNNVLKDALQTGEMEAYAEKYPDASVLFIQVNVAEAGLDGENLVRELNRVFSILDNLVESHHNVYKVLLFLVFCDP
jgi:hypothetical protein